LGITNVALAGVAVNDGVSLINTALELDGVQRPSVLILGSAKCLRICIGELCLSPRSVRTLVSYNWTAAIGGAILIGVRQPGLVLPRVADATDGISARARGNAQINAARCRYGTFCLPSGGNATLWEAPEGEVEIASALLQRFRMADSFLA
jgi:hypothetical protein